MRFIHLAAALPVMALAAPLAAQDFVSLEPSSDWALSLTEDYCVIARNFGEGDKAVQLDLRSYRPEGLFNVLITGQLAQPSSTAERIRFVIGSSEFYDPTFVTGTVGGRATTMLKPVFSFGELPEEIQQRMEADRPVSTYASPEAEAAVRELRFLDGMQQQIGLMTGTMAPVMDALRQCSQRLPDQWGVTYEEHMALSRIAVPRRPFRWMGSRGFQRRLVEGGLWSMVLIVDEEGGVADCRLSGATSPEEAQKACDIAREEARFQPALDAEGNPARDYWSITVQP